MCYTSITISHEPLSGPEIDISDFNHLDFAYWIFNNVAQLCIQKILKDLFQNSIRNNKFQSKINILKN